MRLPRHSKLDTLWSKSAAYSALLVKSACVGSDGVIARFLKVNVASGRKRKVTHLQRIDRWHNLLELSQTANQRMQLLRTHTHIHICIHPILLAKSARFRYANWFHARTLVATSRSLSFTVARSTDTIWSLPVK